VAAANPDAAAIGRRVVFGRLIGNRSLVALASWGVGLMQRMPLAAATRDILRKTESLRTVPLPVPTTAGREWLPDGQPAGTVAFLAGCVMDAWFSDTHLAVIQVLRAAGFRVVVPVRQTCCGALAAHEGATYDAARMAAQNVAAFAEYDRIVVDSAGCSAHMKGYGHLTDDGADLAGTVFDATEFVASLIAEGLLPAVEGDEPIAVQDPCHLRHAQRIIEEPRAILRAAGYRPVEIDPHGMCCGAAGAYQLSHPEVSRELGLIKADQIAATGLTCVASPNPGCEMQLKTYLGPRYEVVHPIELYWQAIQ
jgi:glycolate oxidase iron-sulfur subunit